MLVVFYFQKLHYSPYLHVEMVQPLRLVITIADCLFNEVGSVLKISKIMIGGLSLFKQNISTPLNHYSYF